MHLLAVLLAAAFQAVPSPSPAASAPPSPAATAPASPSPLSASVTAVALQPGASQTITIANGAQPITASLDNVVAAVTIDQTAHTVTLTAGQQPGRATLTITDGSGASIALPVRVAFLAATIPQSVTLRVTGDAPDSAWLQAQVRRAVLQQLALQPGVSAKNVQFAAYAVPQAFAPGAQAAIPVSVTVPGADAYLDAAATVNVTLQNVASNAFESPVLLYDDDPEKIVSNGVLFRGRIAPGTPARLYYYHQNMDAPRRLLVVLSPLSDRDSSTAQVVDASAGPNIDVMSVGHAVTRDFLVRKPHNQGVLIDLAAPLAIDDFPVMQPLDGAAGSIGLNVTNGGPVSVTVLAMPVDATAADIAAALNGPQLPGDGHHRTGMFDISNFAQTALAYTIGSDDVSVEYGAATPPSAAQQSGRDYGEYGVIRTVTFDITNPGTDPASVYLFERPLGGVVRSSFMVNGQLIELGCARLSNRYQIGSPISAPPGTSHVVVQTMTDGGSNYPLELGVTATPPAAATPAMTAPDGCFPPATSTSRAHAGP